MAMNLRQRLGLARMSQENRAGIGAALVLLLIISLVELADGAPPHYIGLLAAVPFLAAAFGAWPEVLVIGGLASAAGLAFGMYPDGRPSGASLINVGGVIIATGVAAVRSSR